MWTINRLEEGNEITFIHCFIKSVLSFDMQALIPKTEEGGVRIPKNPCKHYFSFPVKLIIILLNMILTK